MTMSFLTKIREKIHTGLRCYWYFSPSTLYPFTVHSGKLCSVRTKIFNYREKLSITEVKECKGTPNGSPSFHIRTHSRYNMASQKTTTKAQHKPYIHKHITKVNTTNKGKERETGQEASIST